MYRLFAIPIWFLGVFAVFLTWYLQFGFMPHKGEWWQWLGETIIATHGLPMPLLKPIIIAGAVCFILSIILLFALNGVSARTLSGGVNEKNLHGSARWAEKRDIKKAALFAKKGVVVGGWAGGLFGKVKTLRHNGPEHILCFAPTRSGKGVGLVLPTLLSWPHSTLIFDIKGENYALTAGWRKKQGQKIIKFDPTAENGCSRFNPLAEIRHNTQHFIKDCQNVAMMVADPDGKGLKDIWAKGGFGWFVAILLHVICRIRKEDGRAANFKDVYKFIGQVVNNTDHEDVSASFNRLCEDMIEFEYPNEDVKNAVLSEANNMRSIAHDTRTGIHTNVYVELNLFGDPIITNNISASDWCIDDLMNGDVPASLYLIVPPSDIDRTRRLFRLILNLILRRLMAKMEFENGASKKSYKHHLLLMLDEFTALGKLEIMEQSLAFMAGYGVKAFIIVQDLTQLQKAYSKDESIISNCHIRIAYAPNKIETAKTLSDMAGKTTIVQAKRSKSGRMGDLSKNISESLSEVSRPLLTPDECMALPGMEKTPGGQVKKAGDMLIFPAGFRPIYGRQVLYFQDKDLLAKAKIPPPDVENVVIYEKLDEDDKEIKIKSYGELLKETSA